jgi:hypothetical protein
VVSDVIPSVSPASLPDSDPQPAPANTSAPQTGRRTTENQDERSIRKTSGAIEPRALGDREHNCSIVGAEVWYAAPRA